MDTYSEAMRLFAGRRSVRSYGPEPVSDTAIHAMLRAAVQAPTAMHVEPWLFVVVQDRDALKRCSDVARATILEQPHVYKDLHDPSPTPKNGGFLKALGSPEFNIFYNAGTLVLVCARMTNAFVAADCWLAAGQVMLAATALGLGTCCIGSALPAVNSEAVKADFGIPDDVTVVAAIIVGDPARSAAPTTRRPPRILSWLKAKPHRISGGEGA
jgi:nitroreductase